jgi:hypothetical protein
VRRIIKIALSLGCLAALVIGVEIMFSGLPRPVTPPPTGLGGSPGRGTNVLGLAADTWTRANTWAKEDTIAGTPTFIRHTTSIEIVYAGVPEDTGGHRKLEVFQAIDRGVVAGQLWVFSIRLRGLVVKSYTDVGIEWFGKDWKWMAEKDVYPPLTGSYQRVTVAKVLPDGARYLAVFVQLEQINPATRIDISASGASLIEPRRG